MQSRSVVSLAVLTLAVSPAACSSDSNEVGSTPITTNTAGDAGVDVSSPGTGGSGGTVQPDTGTVADVLAEDSTDGPFCVEIPTDAGEDAMHSPVHTSAVADGGDAGDAAPLGDAAALVDAGAFSVFAPTSLPYGQSYDAWLAQWSQWFFQIPKSTNPILNGDCTQQQSGDVWFLINGRNKVPQQRACTIPAGKALFVPLGATFCYPTPETGCPDPPDPDQTFCLSQWPTAWTVLEVEVDGVPVPDLHDYLFQTGQYDIVNPPTSDPIFSNLGPIPPNSCGFPAGATRSAKTLGFAVMLAPLSSGTHTLRIARQDYDCTYKSDVTYTLTVQ
jgi:hypothetical protein